MHAQSQQAQTKGKSMVNSTNHMNTGIWCGSSGDEVQNLNKSGKKAQDLHKTLKVIFCSHMELQDSGFTWDLRHQGKTHETIEFVTLCGKHTSSTANVVTLWRLQSPLVMVITPISLYKSNSNGLIASHCFYLHWCCFCHKCDLSPCWCAVYPLLAHCSPTLSCWPRTIITCHLERVSSSNLAQLPSSN